MLRASSSASAPKDVGKDTPVQAADLRVPTHLGERAFLLRCLHIVLPALDTDGCPRPRDFLFNQDPAVDIASLTDVAAAREAVVGQHNGLHTTGFGRGSVGHMLSVPLLNSGGCTYSVVVSRSQALHDFEQNRASTPHTGDAADLAEYIEEIDHQVSAVDPKPHALSGRHSAGDSSSSTMFSSMASSSSSARNGVRQSGNSRNGAPIASEVAPTLPSGGTASGATPDSVGGGTFCACGDSALDPSATLEASGSRAQTGSYPSVSDLLHIRGRSSVARCVLNHSSGELLLVDETASSLIAIQYSKAPQSRTTSHHSIRLYLEKENFTAGKLLDSVVFAESEEWNSPPRARGGTTDGQGTTGFSQHLDLLRRHEMDGLHSVTTYAGIAGSKGQRRHTLAWRTSICRNLMSVFRSESSPEFAQLRAELTRYGVKRRSEEPGDVCFVDTARVLKLEAEHCAVLEAVDNVEVLRTSQTPQRTRGGRSYEGKKPEDMTKSERTRWNSLQRARKSVEKRNARMVLMQHTLQSLKIREGGLRTSLHRLQMENVDLRRRFGRGLG